MCGIAVCFSPNHLSEISDLVGDLHHRGPDDEGFFHSHDVNFSMGMRRLSIQDLEGGHQPIFSQNNDYVIVFNGEIFNADQLRSELLNIGYLFRTEHSDTEVIVAGISLYGIDFVQRLNGMFSAAIYNIRDKKIILIRDQLGIKPLYYKIYNNNIAISSEINSLIRLFQTSDISQISTAHFLSFGHIQNSDSIYSDIKQVSPGSIMIIDLDENHLKIEKKSYWSPYKTVNKITFNNEELYAQINSAVDRWSISDVPISLSLSGGTDSSIILHHLLKQGKKPECYAVIFNNGDSPEDTNRKYLVNQYNLNINEIVYDDSRLVDDIENIIYSLGEPYSGSIASWLIYKSAVHKEKVMLSGTGGDELFGNYSKWRYFSKPATLLLDKLKRIKNGNPIHYNYFKNSYKYFPNIFTLEDLLGLMSNENEVNKSWGIMERNLRKENLFTRPSFYDLLGQLTSEFLFMSDRFSMHNSIELRTPLLDISLVDYVLKIPYKDRSRFRNPKKLLIDTYKDKIPSLKILNNKQGFSHQNSLIFGPLKEYFLDLTSDFDKACFPIFDSFNIIESLRNIVLNNETNISSQKYNQIWTIFMFLAWCEKQKKL